MTPKEKAKELINSMERWIGKKSNNHIAVQCALESVDMIMMEIKTTIKTNIKPIMISNHIIAGKLSYWNEVKVEIENFKNFKSYRVLGS